MRVGIVNEETWAFLSGVVNELAQHHELNVFKRRTLRLPAFEGRINRRLYYHDLRSFMNTNDVVFFEWSSDLLAAATHMPKQCPIVTRLHRYEMYEWVEHIEWAAVDKVILVSEAKRREFVARFPAHRQRTVVIPESVSITKFKPQPRQFSGNLGTLCTLIPRKRVYELILMFYELAKQSDLFHLHIAGGSHHRHKDYEEAIYSLVRRLNLQERITFYGHIVNTHEWLQNIDIFISNSYSEGLQVAPMEAMACGCLCFSHRWDGAEELLPDEYLFYTDQELQTKILSYAEASEEVKQYHQNKMQTIIRENFDLKSISRKIQHVIEEVACTKPHR